MNFGWTCCKLSRSSASPSVLLLLLLTSSYWLYIQDSSNPISTIIFEVKAMSNSPHPSVRSTSSLIFTLQPTLTPFLLPTSARRTRWSTSIRSYSDRCSRRTWSLSGRCSKTCQRWQWYSRGNNISTSESSLGHQRHLWSQGWQNPRALSYTSSARIHYCGRDSQPTRRNGSNSDRL